MANRTIMHIDLDAFYVSVEQVLNPELKGKPVVVGGRPGGRGVIAAASYEARAYGIHSAMPAKTASRLCPHAIFVQGDFTRYREASRKFMEILADFSPFLEPGGLDEAFLDVTGFESLHGTIRQMAVSLRKRIKDETGLVASIGIASSKVVAKIASDKSKPDGLLEVPLGEEKAFLAPLSVSRVPGVGKKAEELLTGLGIKTIGKVADTPVEILKRRLGIYGESLHRHANGIDDRKVHSPGGAKSISRETTFGSDISNRARLKATLRFQSEKVGADLRHKDKRARSITLKLRYSDFTTLTRSLTMPQPVNSDEIIFGTGQRLLDKALARDNRPVRLIGIGVSNIVESGGQLAMLDSSEERMTRLDKTIDRIRDKYGFTAIQTGRTLQLKDIFPETENDDSLHTAELSG